MSELIHVSNMQIMICLRIKFLFRVRRPSLPPKGAKGGLGGSGYYFLHHLCTKYTGILDLKIIPNNTILLIVLVSTPLLLPSAPRDKQGVK